MKSILKSKKAEGYIDVAVAVLVIVFLLTLIVNAWSVLKVKQDLNYMCEEIIEAATMSGRIDEEVVKRFDELCAELGFIPQKDFEADFYEGAKVQFGDVITCTLTHEVTLPGFGGFSLPLGLSVTKSGLSRVYWK